MTFDDACEALKAALVAAAIPDLVLTYENDPLPEAPDRAPWALVEFRNISEEQVSLGDPGSNDHEGLGAMVVHIHTVRDKKDRKARQRCDAVAAVFRGKEIGGVQITGILGDDGGHEGVVEGRPGRWWLRWRRIEFDYHLPG